MSSGGADRFVDEVRQAVEKGVRENLGDSILLSGGLDTSILAHLASKQERIACYTVRFTEGESPDVGFAKAEAERLALPWRLVDLKAGTDLEHTAQRVIDALGTFDPMEVRNSVTIYKGMDALAEDGYSRVMTGDAADELFAGYSFVHSLPPARMLDAMHEMWRVMRFSSRQLAESLGIHALIPYLHDEVVAVAEKLPPEELVGSRKGVEFGKYVLRRAFEGLIGDDLAWREKMPIEFGSGTTFLPAHFSKLISDGEFRQKRESFLLEGVRVRDKEQMFYYELYRKSMPPPRDVARTDHRCPGCGGDVDPTADYCVRCGAYHIRPSSTASGTSGAPGSA